MWNLVAKGGTAMAGLFKGAGVAAGVGAAAAVGDQVVTGGSITEKLVGGIGKAFGFGQNEAAAEGGYNWFGQFVEMISRFIKDTLGENGLTQSMDRLSARMQDKDVESIPGYTGGADPRASGPNSTPNANGAGIENADDVSLTTLGIGAVAAAAAPAIGMRAVPVLGGVVAAVDGITDAGSFALKGEWEKAGVRTLSGVADTLGSSLGFVGFAFGQAAREGIENAGEAVLGPEAHLEDGAAVALTKRAFDFVLGGR